MKVKILAHTPNPEMLVASAAKLCYSKTGVEGIQENLNDEQNINNLLREEENKYLNYEFENISENDLILCFKDYIQNRFNLLDGETLEYVNNFISYLHKLQKINNKIKTFFIL